MLAKEKTYTLPRFENFVKYLFFIKKIVTTKKIDGRTRPDLIQPPFDPGSVNTISYTTWDIGVGVNAYGRKLPLDLHSYVRTPFVSCPACVSGELAGT